MTPRSSPVTSAELARLCLFVCACAAQPYLTALLTERTRMPSAMVTDAVAVHFSFAFQHVPKPAELLAQFRMLARNTRLHEQLSRAYGDRQPNRSCRSAAPLALLRQARNRKRVKGDVSTSSE